MAKKTGAAIEKELVKLTGLKRKDGEPQDKWVTRVCKKALSLDEEVLQDMSDDAYEAANAVLDAIEAKEEVILPLLDVIDNFERAVTCDVPNAPEPDDPYRQGVEMILKHLREVLEAQGVTAIETCGADFDPNLHEAVQMIESGNHRSNEVVEELQRGYRMGERLLRCSRVVVAR